jgi:myo-inositol-1-phosphate synthase
MPEIRVAIAGVGNCASALVQGVEYYRARETDLFEGLMHANVGAGHPRTSSSWPPSMWIGARLAYR